MKKIVVIRLEFDTIEPTEEAVLDYLAELVEQETVLFEVEEL
jgi:hypothetical protein